MDTQKALEILNLNRYASLEQAKQAYKTKVKFYHPDRFHNDLKKKEKGEEKLKEINLAYEQVKEFISSRPEKIRPTKIQTPSKPPEKTKTTTSRQPGPEIHFKKEARAVMDVIRNIWSYLYKNLIQMDFKQVFEEGTQHGKKADSQKHTQKAEKNFKQILKEVENRTQNPNRFNKKQKNRNLKNMSRNKRYTGAGEMGHSKGEKRNMGRVEPIRRVRPIDKIRGIGEEK